MTKKKMLEVLEGTENLSLEAEGYVLVENGKLISYGKEIKPTKVILQELWDREVAGCR